MTHGPATKIITLTRSFAHIHGYEQFDVRVSRTAEHYNTRSMEAGFLPHIQFDGMLDNPDNPLTVSLWYEHEDFPGDFVVLSTQEFVRFEPIDVQTREFVDQFIIQNPCGMLGLAHEATRSDKRYKDVQEDDTADAILMQIDQIVGLYDERSANADTAAQIVADVQELVSKWRSNQ